MNQFAQSRIKLTLIIGFINFILLLLIQLQRVTKSISLGATTKLSLSQLCFISCFYPIKPGKKRHSISAYINRSRRLFYSFSKTVPLYIFTNNKGLVILKSAIGQKIQTNIHFILKYQKIYDIPKMAGYKKKYNQIGSEMEKKEKYVVNAKIGSIWNSKMIFIQEVIDHYYPNSTFYFWVDIGLIKNDEMFQSSIPLIWPNYDRILKIFTYDHNRINQRILITSKCKYKFNPLNLSSLNLAKIGFYTLASLFGGPKKAMEYFLNEYWRIHDKLIIRNQFVLREEYVIAAFALFHRDKVYFINLHGSKCYPWHQSVAFISQFNVCNFTNSVMTFHPSNPKTTRLVSINLDSWT